MAEPGAGPLMVDDLETLPDEPGTRYELFGGELHVSPQPHHEHQAVCAQVILGLGEWNKRSPLGRVFTAPGIVFSRFDAAAPDVVWASHAHLAQIAGSDPPLRGAPELVVEVLSPGAANERRDRETKLQAYARYGVDEYWIVDRAPRRSRTTVGRTAHSSAWPCSEPATPSRRRSYPISPSGSASCSSNPDRQ
jgi:Uma2 family endonuclease